MKEMKKSVIVIPDDDDDDCEDLGDLCDFELESIPSQELIDPLQFLEQNTCKKNVPETEQEEPIVLIEINDSSQEQQEDLGDLENHFPNQATSPILNEQFHSETTSSNTVIPDYSQLTIKELQASISRYGFKNLKSREQMVSILESIRVSENLQTPQITSATENDNEERRMIIQHIKSQENVWKKILRYESVNVDEVYHGLTCKKSKVKAVLDDFAALKKRHHRVDTTAI